MIIDWDDVRVFQTAVRAGDYTTAARKLGMNRTTVGRRFSRLERASDRTLWQQTANGYRPTEAGRAVLRAAAAMERAMAGLEEELAVSARHTGGPIRVAGTAGLAALLLPHCARFLTQNSGVSLELIGVSDAIAAVQQRHADIGFAIARTMPRDLHGVQIGDFKQARYVSRLAPSGRHIAWSHNMMLANPQPWARLNAPQAGSIGVEVGSLSDMIEAVRAGIGAAWLWQAVGEPDRTLKRLEDSAPSSADAGLWVVHRGDIPLEPAVAALKDAASEIVGQFVAATKSEAKLAPGKG